MKGIFRLLIALLVPALLTSCLKKDLPVAANSSLNDVSDFNLLYKYVDTVIDNPGTPQEVTRIFVNTIQLDKSKTISNDTVYIDPTFPSGFPRSEKPIVTLKDIIGYANIPDAATIKSVGSAPELGTPGDFSVPVTYEVIAANGDKKEWVISVAPLPEVNQWEGIYEESGTLNHATAGLQTCPPGFETELLTTGPNTVKATAGYWYFENTGITYFITVNSDNSVTISADPAAVVAIQQETTPASTYDPVTRTFHLYYYYYSGGDAANWRKFETVLTYKP